MGSNDEGQLPFGYHAVHISVHPPVANFKDSNQLPYRRYRLPDQ